MSADLGVWLGALMSLGIYSYLYKENPAFRVCEHIYLGLSLAHLAVMGWTNVQDLGLTPLMNGDLSAWIPLCLGLLLFTRFIPRWGWLGRYSLAYLVGVAAAITVTGVVDAGIISQIRGAIVPLDSFNSLFSLIANVSAISVFFFIIGSKSEKKGGSRAFSKVIRWGSVMGRFILMISFGAVFGTTVMARLGLFIPRLEFLFGEWIHLIPVIK